MSIFQIIIGLASQLIARSQEIVLEKAKFEVSLKIAIENLFPEIIFNKKKTIKVAVSLKKTKINEKK